MQFWEPIFRAWLTALPYFIVGMLGAVIQLRRLRQHVADTVATSARSAVAEAMTAHLRLVAIRHPEGRHAAHPAAELDAPAA